MTDSDIVAMAQLRYGQLNRNNELHHGDFDLCLSPTQTAYVVVHDGKIKHITIPNREEGYRKKILLSENGLG